jgi:plastocyanin
MSRIVIVVAIALAGIAALPAAAGTDGLSFVQVVEKEWTVTPSRPRVKAGNVSVELVNFGMDNHDLVVQGAKPGSKPLRFKQLSPRARTERTLRLTAGRYTLSCSLPGHKARGMRATLVVTK